MNRNEVEMNEIDNLISRLNTAAEQVPETDEGVFLKTELQALSGQLREESERLQSHLANVVHASASYRGVLEEIKNTARKEENDNSDLTDVHRTIYIRDLLGSIAYKTSQALKSSSIGADLRHDLRLLENQIDLYEHQMQQAGGWRWTQDRTLTDRLARIVDHYTRMAARAVENQQNERNGMVSWLRGIAITAQSVSWASTHHEKDARLRGLIEVVETAITKIQQQDNDSSHYFDGNVDSWMKSDFPTRDLKRRILDQQAEIERLKRLAGEEKPEAAAPPEKPPF
jgi:hypothetical protein